MAPFPGTPAHRQLTEGGEEEYKLGNAGQHPTYDPVSDAGVIGWRVECFESYGMGHTDAMLLALRKDIDRAVVERMRAQGATPAQVLGALL